MDGYGSEMAARMSLIVMGVSGSGKTTVAVGIADQLGWVFAEGDSFHPDANVEKMASGHPLTDADRWPWLRAIGEWIDDQNSRGNNVVVTCSALRRTYRDFLREGRTGMRLCHVFADEATIADRLKHREGHYMPASLLPSQLATLEPLGPDEPGVTVSAGPAPREVVADALRALGLVKEEEPS
jgi:gluconokinase